jgi:ATP-dependent Lhr-like helicase
LAFTSPIAWISPFWLIEPVTPQQFVSFLLGWHHLTDDTQVRGRAGLLSVLEQLQGYELPAGSWEAVLSARVANYQPAWLDELCLGGEIVWGRLSPRVDQPELPQRLTPSRATRVTLTTRADFGWLLAAGRGDRQIEPGDGAVGDLVSVLGDRGAKFHSELVDDLDLSAGEVEETLWNAVGLGLVTADSFSAVRSLFASRKPRSARHSLGRRGLRRGAVGHERSEGRWALLPKAVEIEDSDELAEAIAEQLLARWGVVFRDLVLTETLAVPWREVQWAFRRLEARGLIRGGRFVHGFAGEQYASVEAIRALRQVRRKEHRSGQVDVLAVDPCNITGVILPGDRVRAVGSATIRLIEGKLADDPLVPDVLEDVFVH